MVYSHFSVIARFRISSWMADVACPVVCQPNWPACWLDTPDRSSLSSTRLVQDVWCIYREELGAVPEEVVLALRDAVSRPSVDDFWSIWSRDAELGLFRASSKAGGPTEAGSSAFLGRGLLRIRNRPLGGRAVGGKGSRRLYRVSHGDEVDVHCAQFFVNSSLSPVLLFRRRLKSVADVLKGIRSKGFTQSRWDALLRYWGAVCRHGPCGPISSLHPWDDWIPPDLHGFFKWVFDGFLRQVVISRREFPSSRSQMSLRTAFQGEPVSAVLHELRGLRRLQSYHSPTCTLGQLNPNGFEGSVSTEVDKGENFGPCGGGALKVERSHQVRR